MSEWPESGMDEKEVTRERRDRRNCNYRDGTQDTSENALPQLDWRSHSQPRLHLATQSPYLQKQSIGICPYVQVYSNRSIASSSPSSSS
jgi:hypothetical protein